MSLRQVMRSILTINLVLVRYGASLRARPFRCRPGGEQRTARPTTSSNVAHAPDGLVAVFTNQQATIFRDGDSDRATPDFAVGRNEAGHEIFILAGRFAGRFVECYAHHFVTSTFH